VLPLRFHCVEVCLDRTQYSCDSALAVRCSNHSLDLIHINQHRNYYILELVLHQKICFVFCVEKFQNSCNFIHFQSVFYLFDNLHRSYYSECKINI
jgi:hypothetical protein